MTGFLSQSYAWKYFVQIFAAQKIVVQFLMISQWVFVFLFLKKKFYFILKRKSWHHLYAVLNCSWISLLKNYALRGYHACPLIHLSQSSSQKWYQETLLHTLQVVTLTLLPPSPWNVSILYIFDKNSNVLSTSGSWFLKFIEKWKEIFTTIFSENCKYIFPHSKTYYIVWLSGLLVYFRFFFILHLCSS